MGSKNTTSESYIEKEFVQICKRNGMRVIKMSAQFESGIPDRLVLYKGFAGFAEIKAPGKKPTRIQNAYMNKLDAEGNFVQLISNSNQIVFWIANFKEHIECKRIIAVERTAV